MQDTRPVQKYGVTAAVIEEIYDDPELLAWHREDTVARWREKVAEEGCTAIEEPTIQVDLNIGFGWPLYNTDDTPMLGEDGEQLTDPVKAIITVYGSVA